MDISPLTLHDQDEWASLLSAAFDRSHAEMADVLDRLHAAFPILAWGAWDGPVLAAQYSSLLTELYIPSTHAPGMVGMCVNMATHPDYRGQGLIKQVARPVYEELAARGGVAGVGFSNAAGVRVDRHSRSYGYHVVGRMQPQLAVLLRAPRVPPLQLTDKWPTLSFPLPVRESIHFVPTAVWLRYRFVDHPQRAYHFAPWIQDGQTYGVIAYRLLPGRYGIGAALLAAYSPDPAELVIRWAQTMWDSGVRMIYLLTTPGSPWTGLLRRVALMLPLPASRHPYFLTVKPLCEDVSATLLDFGRWDCLGGDIL